MDEEEFLGGFTSSNLKKGMMKGYGVYATGKRMIGIKSRMGAITSALVGGLVGGALGAIASSKIGEKLAKDESAKAIKELDEKKDFEVHKEQISLITIKKPAMFSGGHLLITIKSGEENKVAIYCRKEFDDTRNLVQLFYPQVLRVIERTGVSHPE